MKIIPTFALALLFGASGLAAQEMQHLGNFHNVTSADEGGHCSGYSLDLWKTKGELFGLFNVHAGLCGDPPCGAIKDIKFRPEDGSMTFQTSVKDEVYRFDGELMANAVSGKVNGEAIYLAREPEEPSSDLDNNLPAWCEFWRSIPRCEGVKAMCASFSLIQRN